MDSFLLTGTTSAGKRMRSSGSFDSTLSGNVGASRIGVMVAEEVQSQEANDRSNVG